MELAVAHMRAKRRGCVVTDSFSVAEDFSADLGGRYIIDGDFSGQEFREKKLLRLVDAAFERRTPVRINFDGVESMPPSFLEEAFGGLARRRRNWSAEDLDRLVVLEAPRSRAFWPYIEFARDAMLKQARLNR